MQTAHENKQLPVIWQNMLAYYERFPRTRQRDDLDVYRAQCQS